MKGVHRLFAQCGSIDQNMLHDKASLCHLYNYHNTWNSVYARKFALSAISRKVFQIT